MTASVHLPTRHVGLAFAHHASILRPPPLSPQDRFSALFLSSPFSSRLKPCCRRHAGRPPFVSQRHRCSPPRQRRSTSRTTSATPRQSVLTRDHTLDTHFTESGTFRTLLYGFYPLWTWTFATHSTFLLYLSFHCRTSPLLATSRLLLRAWKRFAYLYTTPLAWPRPKEATNIAQVSVHGLSPQVSRYACYGSPSRAVEATSAHHGLRRHVQSQYLSSGSRGAIAFIHTRIHTHSLSPSPPSLSLPLAPSPSLGNVNPPRISDLYRTHSSVDLPPALHQGSQSTTNST